MIKFTDVNDIDVERHLFSHYKYFLFSSETMHNTGMNNSPNISLYVKSLSKL